MAIEANNDKRLVTYAEYQQMSPRAQGFVVYMEVDWPGSELKSHQKNPYTAGTEAAKEWDEGRMQGVIEAQDSEE